MENMVFDVVVFVAYIIFDQPFSFRKHLLKKFVLEILKRGIEMWRMELQLFFNKVTLIFDSSGK